MNSTRHVRPLALLVLPFAVAAGLTLASRPAAAGTKSRQEVYMTGPDATVYKAYTAEGSLGSARASADGLQDIGCDIGFDLSADINNGARSGGCWARNAVGTNVSCYIPQSWTTQWENFARVLATAGPTPYIYFKAIRTQFGDYVCANIHVYGHADHAPPAP